MLLATILRIVIINKIIIFVLHLFQHSLQLTNNPIVCELSHISLHIHCNRPAIICEFSNCALSCISFHIDCKRLAILSFSDFEVVRCPASLSTLVAIDLLSCHFLILKLCVVLQFIPIYRNRLDIRSFVIFKLCPLLHLFPHTLQSTSHSIISDFKIVRLPAPLSLLSAIDLPSDHLCIFKLCVFLHLFQNHCN